MGPSSSVDIVNPIYPPYRRDGIKPNRIKRIRPITLPIFAPVYIKYLLLKLVSCIA
jgi:hypothetical protein